MVSQVESSHKIKDLLNVSQQNPIDNGIQAIANHIDSILVNDNLFYTIRIPHLKDTSNPFLFNLNNLKTLGPNYQQLNILPKLAST